MKKDSPAALRATADQKVSRARELADVADAKRKEANAYAAANPLPYGHRPSTHRMTREAFRTAVLNREALEAEDTADRARLEAVVALDAADAVDGEEKSLAHDLKSVRENLATLKARREEIEAQLASARQREADCAGTIARMEAEHAARRTARRASLGPGFAHVFSVLDRSQQIAQARNLEMALAANLEEQAREKEAEEKAREEDRKAREREEKRRQEEARAEVRARDAERDAEERKRRELADAYRARL